MSAFTAPTVKTRLDGGTGKCIIYSITGTASYDSDGSTVDLSAATLGAWDGFNEVFAAAIVGFAAAADTQYLAQYVIGSSGAPATGKLVVYDLTGGVSGANVGQASGNLSAITFYLMVFGR